jgi:hypothetical protein
MTPFLTRAGRFVPLCFGGKTGLNNDVGQTTLFTDKTDGLGVGARVR